MHSVTLKKYTNMARTSTATKKLIFLRNRFQMNNRKKRIRFSKIYKERKEKGEYQMLLKDVGLHDHFLFIKYFRMCPTM